MGYAPQSFPPSSLRPARPAPAATVRCAARSLRSSAGSALARSASCLASACSGCAPAPVGQHGRCNTFQRPCAPHHRPFPHPHSPIACGLRIAGVVWAHGAIAATLHNVPFCARRPSPPGPCRGMPARQPARAGSLTAKHTLCKMAACTTCSIGVPAAPSPASCTKPARHPWLAASLGAAVLRVGLAAGLRRYCRHALSRRPVGGRCAWGYRLGFVGGVATRTAVMRIYAHTCTCMRIHAPAGASRFFLSRCCSLTAVHRLGTCAAVARGVIARTSLVLSPRATARSVTGHTHCSLGPGKASAVLGPSRTVQVRCANP